MNRGVPASYAVSCHFLCVLDAVSPGPHVGWTLGQRQVPPGLRSRPPRTSRAVSLCDRGADRAARRANWAFVLRPLHWASPPSPLYLPKKQRNGKDAGLSAQDHNTGLGAGGGSESTRPPLPAPRSELKSLSPPGGGERPACPRPLAHPVGSVCDQPPGPVHVSHRDSSRGPPVRCWLWVEPPTPLALLK